jgi:phage tail-like protein
MTVNHPYPGYNFLVDAGLTQASFREVSQLSSSVDVIEYREGSDKADATRKFPGLRRTSEVVLRRGIMGSNDLFAWFGTINGGQVEKRDVRISLLNEDHEPVMQWLLINAWPRSYAAGPFDAMTSTVAIEQLVLVFDSLQLQQ